MSPSMSPTSEKGQHAQTSKAVENPDKWCMAELEVGPSVVSILARTGRCEGIHIDTTWKPSTRHGVAPGCFAYCISDLNHRLTITRSGLEGGSHSAAWQSNG